MKAPSVYSQLAHKLEVSVHGLERRLQGVLLFCPRPVLGPRTKRVAAVTPEAVPVRNTELQPATGVTRCYCSNLLLKVTAQSLYVCWLLWVSNMTTYRIKFHVKSCSALTVQSLHL